MNCLSFSKIAGEPHWLSSPLATTLTMIPPVGDVGNCEVSEVPTVKQLGYEDILEVCHVLTTLLNHKVFNFSHQYSSFCRWNHLYLKVANLKH